MTAEEAMARSAAQTLFDQPAHLFCAPGARLRKVRR